jgi:ribose transport system permease protein
VICIVATIFSPHDSTGAPIFLNHVNLTNIVRQVSETGIIALAMTLVILAAGIDLSVGSVLALGATICAKLLSDWQPALGATSHMAAAGLLAVAACGVIGAVNGAVIAYARMQPFVVTLAAMIGIRGLAKWLTENKNIGLGFGADSVSGQFAAVLSQKSVVIGTFAVLIVIFAFVLNRTVFGRYIRAIGGNMQAAMYAGLPIRSVEIAVYAISGLMAGLAGVLHAAQNHQGNPNDGVAYELDAIAAVVIGGTPLTGGKGSIIGTVIGTLIIGVITNIMGLRGWDENVKWMAKAVIIIAAVLFQQTTLFSRLRLRRAKAA